MTTEWTDPKTGTATAEPGDFPPLLCACPRCATATTDQRSAAILAVHEGFYGAIKGALSCAEVPYPLHEGTSHSYLCQAMVNVVTEEVAKSTRRASQIIAVHEAEDYSDCSCRVCRWLAKHAAWKAER